MLILARIIHLTLNFPLPPLSASHEVWTQKMKKICWFFFTPVRTYMKQQSLEQEATANLWTMAVVGEISI